MSYYILLHIMNGLLYIITISYYSFQHPFQQQNLSLGLDTWVSSPRGSLPLSWDTNHCLCPSMKRWCRARRHRVISRRHGQKLFWILCLCECKLLPPANKCLKFGSVNLDLVSVSTIGKSKGDSSKLSCWWHFDLMSCLFCLANWWSEVFDTLDQARSCRNPGEASMGESHQPPSGAKHDSIWWGVDLPHACHMSV